jgi:hypothetical protein
MCHPTAKGEPPWIAIHEVYYDAKGAVKDWSENGVPVGAESVFGLVWVLSKMLEAFSKPVLDFKTGKVVPGGKSTFDLPK